MLTFRRGYKTTTFFFFGEQRKNFCLGFTLDDAMFTMALLEPTLFCARARRIVGFVPGDPGNRKNFLSLELIPSVNKIK